VQNGLSPRMLAQAIAERSAANASTNISSPDAFAHRTSEASIAEQLGDVLVANGCRGRRLPTTTALAAGS